MLQAERSGVSLEALEHGRGLFVARCGNCHNTPDPGSHDAASWAKILPGMLEDSHLNAEEGALVLSFLQALASDAGAALPLHAARQAEAVGVRASP